jgi:hypothetical protein
MSKVAFHMYIMNYDRTHAPSSSAFTETIGLL